MGYVRILFLDVTAWSERLKLLDFILVVYSYFKSPRVDPRRPSGSIKGFEQGRGTGCPSLPLCLIEESLFGAAIHNLLRLIRSLQSGRHQFFHFSPAWGTYESYSLMWQLGRAIEVIGLAIRRLRLQFQYGFAVCISNRKRILNEKIVNYKVIFKFYNFRIKKRTCSFI